MRITRFTSQLAALLAALLTALLTGQNAAGAGLDSRTAIERAVLQIELGDLALARSYLQRPLIDPSITVTERSRAYYLQGYSLQLAGHHVSAAQNYAKALGFNPDNPATLAALGDLYARGLGVQKDAQQARELLRRSAELGHAPGMTRLGAWLLNELKNSPTPDADLIEARAALSGAASADDAEALLFLAQSYRATHSSNPDPEKARQFYEQALILNEPAAFNSIGHMHLSGEFGEQNPQAAVTAFTRGAAAKDGPALVSLGYLYLAGSHVAKDLAAAERLFHEAAALGETRAHHYLGYLAETAPSTKNPATHAIEHYKKASRGNYPPALKRLSELAFENNQPALGISYLRALVDATKDRAAKTLTSTHQLAAHRLAWTLATHQDEAIRDGAAAIRFAAACVTFERSAATLDTLAAAYAEASDFSAAIKAQNEALELLAQSQPSTARTQDYELRLAAYQAQKPWRD